MLNEEALLSHIDILEKKVDVLRSNYASILNMDVEEPQVHGLFSKRDVNDEGYQTNASNRDLNQSQGSFKKLINPSLYG